MNYLPIVIFVLVIAALLFFSTRARRRQAMEQATRQERIGVGTDVMTTSGLHATVVAVHDDGTVQLSIAPGVEVTWELAALRDRDSLPAQYRHGPDPDAEPAAEAAAEPDPDDSSPVELTKDPDGTIDSRRGSEDA